MSSSGLTGPQRRYAVAGALVVLAIALGAAFGLIAARALAGYSITPVADPASSTVTVGDRSLAIWVSPKTAATDCSAIDVTSGRSSMRTGLATSMTVTDSGRSWKRVGVVEADPGSQHQLTCSAERDLVIGQADNPRLARYVVLGALLGGTAVLLVLTAFTLALVTALRKKPAAG